MVSHDIAIEEDFHRTQELEYFVLATIII